MKDSQKNKIFSIKNAIKLSGMIVGAIVVLFSLPVLLDLPKNDHSDLWSLWVGMHFNTALAVASLGIALNLMMIKKFKAARAISSIAFLIGGATLIEYIFGIDLHIDQYFQIAQASFLHHPGRMPPNTTVTFLASGLSLFLLSRKNPGGFAVVAAGTLGSIAAGFGLIKITSTLFGISGSLDAQSFFHMNLVTGIAVTLIGGLLICHCLIGLKINKEESYRIVPFCVSLSLIMLTLTLWQALINIEAKHIQQLVLVNSENMSSEVKERILQMSLALKRFATRVEYLGFKDKKYLELDASSYLNQIPALKRLGLIDTKNKVFWSYPLSMSKQVDGYDQSINVTRKSALEQAYETREPSLSGSTALLSGGRGFILPVALFRKEKFSGFLYASVELNKVFQNLEESPNFEISVFEDGNEIFSEKKQDAEREELSLTRSLTLGQANLELVLVPTEHFIEQNHSRVPYIILLGGTGLTILLGILLQILALARRNDQKHAESEKILMSRLNIALKSTEIGLWSIDLVTGETWRSQNHDEIFGYPKPLQKWSREVFLTHVVPEDRARVRAEQSGASQRGENLKSEFRIKRTDDNSIHWIKSQSRILLDENNKPSQVIGVIEDTTKQKLEESERIASIEWRTAILSATDYALISADDKGVIQTFNAAAERMLGYNASEIIGKQTPAIFHEPSEIVARASQLSKELKRNIEPGFDVFTVKTKQQGHADENEWTYIRKDGTKLPISLSVTVLSSNEGRVTGYLGVAIDLTERKKAQEQLFTTHERLARVIDATGEGIWERDFDTRKVQFIDLQCRHIFGFDADEEITFEVIRSVVHPDDIANLNIEIEKHIKERTPRFEVEYRIISRKAGEAVRWARTKGKVLIVDGKPERLVSTVSDITQEIENRNKLKEALIKAESATEAKSNFLATMSHEIRTPLNGIIGMTDLLIETELDSQQQKYAEIVQQSGTNLLALISDILDFSKIEAGKLELESEEFSLSQLVESQADVLAARATNQGISLMTFISSEVPNELVGDAGRIGQILVNLIGNAVKFTKNGGVSVRAVKCPHRVADIGSTWVRFEIEDTGIGLTEEGKLKLFKPFVQVDGGAQRQYGGTGLGLSISKRLVETMGGEIGVESAKGHGSVFWFEIQFTLSKVKNFSRTKWKPDELHNVHVLVVDDDVIARDTVDRYLISWGMRSSRATSFSDAIELVGAANDNHDPFTIALVGYGQKSEEGLLLGNILNQRFGDQRPKLLLMVEIGKSVPASKLESNYYEDVLYKPIKQSALFDALANTLTATEIIEQKMQSAPSATALKEDLSGVKILVADDIAANQMLAIKLLENLGYSAHAVANGHEVLAAVRSFDYDLILMDCQMPGLDGFEATKAIREMEKSTNNRIAIIALTANAMAGDSQKCIAAGMDDYLSKPIKKDKLKSMMSEWLKHRNERTKKASGS